MKILTLIFFDTYTGDFVSQNNFLSDVLKYSLAGLIGLSTAYCGYRWSKRNNETKEINKIKAKIAATCHRITKLHLQGQLALLQCKMFRILRKEQNANNEYLKPEEETRLKKYNDISLQIEHMKSDLYNSIMEYIYFDDSKRLELLATMTLIDNTGDGMLLTSKDDPFDGKLTSENFDELGIEIHNQNFKIYMSEGGGKPLTDMEFIIGSKSV